MEVPGSWSDATLLGEETQFWSKSHFWERRSRVKGACEVSGECVWGGAQGGQEADLRKRRDLGGSNEMGKEGPTELSFADSVAKAHLAFTCSFCSYILILWSFSFPRCEMLLPRAGEEPFLSPDPQPESRRDPP